MDVDVLVAAALPRPSWMCPPLRHRRLLINVTSGRGEDHGSEITDERTGDVASENVGQESVRATCSCRFSHGSAGKVGNVGPRRRVLETVV